MSGEEFATAYELVRGKVLERLGRNSEAEDAIQEVSIRAYKKAAQFENEDQVFAYLWTAVEEQLRRNAARAGERRRKLKNVWRVERQGAHAGSDVEDRLELEAACQPLSPELRQAVIDVLFHGKTYRETGVPVATLADAVEVVRSRMREAA